MKDANGSGGSAVFMRCARGIPLRLNKKNSNTKGLAVS